MGCAGLVGAYLWPMGGAPTVKSCYLLRLFGFAVGAWASTGDNWASPLERKVLPSAQVRCGSRSRYMQLRDQSRLIPVHFLPGPVLFSLISEQHVE